MKGQTLRWIPAAILVLGVVLLMGIGGQRSLALRTPLDTAVPAALGQYQGKDFPIPTDEQQVAGMSDYLMRVYSMAGTAAFSLYVGYYESQTNGKTIHSPKNCLPGAGWAALTSAQVPVETPHGPVMVNQYLVQKDKDLALVLYWYQGRGRVESNEYRVKWDLLRDAAFRHRSDEALVRIVVPVQGSQQDALQTAKGLVGKIVPAVYRALPA